MTMGFIGDIVGRPGREIIKAHLANLKKEYGIDLVIANYENASHGFGLNAKNAAELFESGIDAMSGGNHSFDKKEITSLFESHPIIRPLNYPKSMPGEGVLKTTIDGTKVALVNLMGHFAMPMCDNPFNVVDGVLKELQEEGYKHIVIDMHAEATSEKQALLHMQKEYASAILGTHTHIGTDDLSIVEGCCYVSDVGLTGCRDGVIGMDKSAPINRFMNGFGEYFDVPKECKSILQMIIFTLDDEGRCTNAQKIKVYSEGDVVITQARLESK